MFSFKELSLWVVAFAGSLYLLSMNPENSNVATPQDKTQGVVLLQSGHRMTKNDIKGPGGIKWSNRDPYLDKDYPKDDQPGEPPEFTTEAPPEPIDTAPAPSKIYTTPAPSPKLVVGKLPPPKQGPPWKWSARDPYLDGDFTEDDQPTASPGLLR